MLAAVGGALVAEDGRCLEHAGDWRLGRCQQTPSQQFAAVGDELCSRTGGCVVRRLPHPTTRRAEQHCSSAPPPVAADAVCWLDTPGADVCCGAADCAGHAAVLQAVEWGAHVVVAVTGRPQKEAAQCAHVLQQIVKGAAVLVTYRPRTGPAGGSTLPLRAAGGVAADQLTALLSALPAASAPLMPTTPWAPTVTALTAAVCVAGLVWLVSGTAVSRLWRAGRRRVQLAWEASGVVAAAAARRRRERSRRSSKSPPRPGGRPPKRRHGAALPQPQGRPQSRKMSPPRRPLRQPDGTPLQPPPAQTFADVCSAAEHIQTGLCSMLKQGGSAERPCDVPTRFKEGLFSPREPQDGGASPPTTPTAPVSAAQAGHVPGSSPKRTRLGGAAEGVCAAAVWQRGVAAWCAVAAHGIATLMWQGIAQPVRTLVGRGDAPPEPFDSPAPSPRLSRPPSSAMRTGLRIRRIMVLLQRFQRVWQRLWLRLGGAAAQLAPRIAVRTRDRIVSVCSVVLASILRALGEVQQRSYATVVRWRSRVQRRAEAAESWALGLARSTRQSVRRHVTENVAWTRDRAVRFFWFIVRPPEPQWLVGVGSQQPDDDETDLSATGRPLQRRAGSLHARALAVRAASRMSRGAGRDTEAMLRRRVAELQRLLAEARSGAAQSPSPRAVLPLDPDDASTQDSIAETVSDVSADLRQWEHTDQVTSSLGRAHKRIWQTKEQLRHTEQLLAMLKRPDAEASFDDVSWVPRQSTETARAKTADRQGAERQRVSFESPPSPAADGKMKATQTPSRFLRQARAGDQLQQVPPAADPIGSPGARRMPRLHARPQADSGAVNRQQWGVLRRGVRFVGYLLWPWGPWAAAEPAAECGGDSESEDGADRPFEDPSRSGSASDGSEAAFDAGGEGGLVTERICGEAPLISDEAARQELRKRRAPWDQARVDRPQWAGPVVGTMRCDVEPLASRLLYDAPGPEHNLDPATPTEASSEGK
eukprot:TRINITY_DN17326_c0_g1_i2.p1 TRINITY_DN17326_c0_g1~~TRINITY_DN17326_c0_g1_i2.p1  ORF type:complete len:1109 (+),score=269.02 TRINITY_DN17326_c0_g1_i2:370-3327(+)